MRQALSLCCGLPQPLVSRKRPHAMRGLQWPGHSAAISTNYCAMRLAIHKGEMP